METENKEIKKPTFKKVIEKAKKPKFIKILIIVLVIIVVLCSSCYLVLNKTTYGKNLKATWQQERAIKENQDILKNLSRILLLPQGNPTMAIVTDSDLLKKQQPGFFANAKNGDRVIIYPGMIIVFDAKANKIIKVGPILPSSAPAEVTTPTTAPKSGN